MHEEKKTVAFFLFLRNMIRRRHNLCVKWIIYETLEESTHTHHAREVFETFWPERKIGKAEKIAKVPTKKGRSKARSCLGLKHNSFASLSRTRNIRFAFYYPRSLTLVLHGVVKRWSTFMLISCEVSLFLFRSFWPFFPTYYLQFTRSEFKRLKSR